jgi:hypothetical protein
MRLIWLCFFLTCVAIPGWSDEPAPAQPLAMPLPLVPPEAIPNEPSIFEGYPQPWLIEGILEAPLYSFYLGAPNVRGMAYLPNFAPKLGPRIYYRGAGMTATFALPIPQAELDRRGHTTEVSFIFNPFQRQFGFDFYYQHYQGFYEDNPLTELRTDKPDAYPQLPDAAITNAGVNAYYIFRPEHYSLAAAFNQTEFQTLSGGSWLINPFYNHLSLAVGSIFIPGSDPSGPQSAPAMQGGTFDTLGVGAGYGYAYIYQRCFVTLQGAVGIGPQFQEIDHDDGSEDRNLAFAAKMNVNLSGGYNWKTYLTGVKILVDSLSAQVGSVQMYSSLVSGQFFFGGHF